MVNVPSAGDSFYTTHQAAKLLKVSLKTVQLWVESGVLQAWKTPGGHRRVTEESIQRLLDQRRESVAADSSATRGRRVLVVDDDERTRRLYQLTIERWGLPVELTLAGDGFEGLLHLGSETPHMLITDLDMPGMNGFSMIQSLRANSRYGAVPIVVITGMSAAEIGAGGLPQDVQVLPKPIPFGELRTIVENELFSR